MSKVPRDSADVLRKSSLYAHSGFAFKYVNRWELAYPWYFDTVFPLGNIERDLGVVENDFYYSPDQDVKYPRLNVDWGTSRAYQVTIPITGTSGARCIALTHESGLEIFLIAASAFAGAEVAKYAIKRLLEEGESRINCWWKERTIHEQSSREPLVTKILVRTPNWELAIDGSFDSHEREEILDYIDQHLVPCESIAEYFVDVQNDELAQKLRANVLRIERRPTSEP
ncbi:MAG: hypothetical protein IPK02_10850 [Candidatus Accumulibacter sp.]|uniref:Uncharacterized protein n=1 Tax=Candidatus Accumulibacter affinis TaxID=2954384 RepID=A0A935THQ7_9PROT|nr:hypothetical protein [Candidatus Accumulibacter affinis]